MYREPNDNQSGGLSLHGKNGLPPKNNNRLSYQPKGLEANTPGYYPNKASDLIRHMNNDLSLPRIQSGRSSHLAQPSPAIMDRQHSRAKMLEIQQRHM